MRQGRKHLKEKEFNTIKSLLETGLKHNKIGELLNHSHSTVSTVSTSANFADYKYRTAQRAIKKPVATKSDEVKVVYPETSKGEDVAFMLNKINNTLWVLVKILEKKKIIF